MIYPVKTTTLGLIISWCSVLSSTLGQRTDETFEPYERLPEEPLGSSDDSGSFTWPETSSIWQYQAGNTMNITWNTSYLAVNLWAVPDYSWATPFNLISNTALTYFEWTVSCYKNCSKPVPWVIRAVDARGDFEAQQNLGFVSAQFWIHADESESSSSSISSTSTIATPRETKATSLTSSTSSTTSSSTTARSFTTSSSVFTSSVTSSSVAAPTSAQEEPAESSSPAPQNNNTALAVGAGVGIGAFLVIAAVAVWILVRRRRRKRAPTPYMPNTSQPQWTSPPYDPSTSDRHKKLLSPYEIDVRSPQIHEAPSWNMEPQELDSGRR